MSATMDAIVAGRAAGAAAGLVDDAALEALRANHEQLSLVAELVTPLEDPGAVYHPRQIETRRDKESGEFVFLRARGTVANLARLVTAYGVRVRYNELAREIEVWVGEKIRDGELSRNTNLALIEDLCRINSYPHTQVAGNLWSLAALDPYNPALDWILSKPWDGTYRIGDLFDCLTVTDAANAQAAWVLFRKWIIGSAAILSGYATKFEHVLVLVDPNGGIGKTRFFNTLCPAIFQADGVTLDTENKDSVLQVVSKWLVELGEIGATFSRSDTESLKAFLSRSEDEIRPPYARASNRYPRRTAFFGSVNNVRFLTDDTNNRRFWPIEVSAIDYQHTVDVQQIWAEALHQVKAGEIWHLTPDENSLVGERNETFRNMDRVEEGILTMYDSKALASRYLSATQVLTEIGIVGAKVGDLRKAGVVLRKLFAKVARNNVTMYHMPLPRSQARHLTPVRDDYANGPF